MLIYRNLVRYLFVWIVFLLISFLLEEGNIETALRKGFLEFDKEMALDEEMREDLAGTTAICVVVKDNKLFCGNVGDSRAIASVNGNVEILSNDHKPNNDDERKRITAAGGWVEFNRVNGKILLEIFVLLLRCSF